MGPSTQALFSLEWAAYLREEALRKGKEILWLNLDESNISVIMKNTRGSIKRLPKRGRWRWAAKIKAKLEHIRQTFTYVGLICSDPEIQPLLPQVILIGEKKVSWVAEVSVTFGSNSQQDFPRLPGEHMYAQL